MRKGEYELIQASINLYLKDASRKKEENTEILITNSNSIIWD